MASRQISIRIDPEALERIDAEARLSKQSRSEVTKTLIEEGLRMKAHPGIVFRPGPAGRRPALAVGPDVWEVVRAFSDEDRTKDKAIRRTAALMNLDPYHIQTALIYYAEYADEIDCWLTRLDEEARLAEAEWHQQELLRKQ